MTTFDNKNDVAKLGGVPLNVQRPHTCCKYKACGERLFTPSVVKTGRWRSIPNTSTAINTLEMRSLMVSCQGAD